jgi:hypothetical protein
MITGAISVAKYIGMLQIKTYNFTGMLGSPDNEKSERGI